VYLGERCLEILGGDDKLFSSVPETIEMTLRNAFCLRVPQKWMRDSWVQGGVVFVLVLRQNPIILI